MRDRAEQTLKIVCLALAALLAVQFIFAILRSRSLARVNIPALPSLSAGTNAPVTGKGATNGTPMAAANTATNISGRESAKPGTNAVAYPRATEIETNLALHPGASSLPTNSAAISTNSVMAIDRPNTNGVVRSESEKSGTNSLARLDSGKSNTNSIPPSVKGRASGPDMAGAGMSPMGMNPSGKKMPELPPATKARVDRIVESEVFGPIMRPQPMALLGIAGDVAFLRSPSGQTGLVKEGDSLGELKLVRIGINRVLVEESGQKKELMIFSGYGGESLLSKTKETSDETNH